MTISDNRDATEATGRERPKRKPRVGWADASKKIAEAGDDALVWPEFPNADDNDLYW
jgi:antitoxin MazE